MEQEFHKKELENGLKILFEKRKLPVVTSSVTTKFGAEFEVEKIKGISHFIEHLVFKGTKKRSVKEIGEEVEKRGGVINAFTSEEVTSFWNKLPSKHLAVGIDISSDLVLNPLFENEALERERKVILEEIKMYHDMPRSYVFDKIKELLYEKPFGISIAGTHGTMSKVSRNDVLNVFNSVYSPENMFVTVVGNADFGEICEITEKIFPKKKAKPKITQEIIPVLRNGELIEKRKGIDQANVVLGYHVPTLQDKNRYCAEILNVILAGGMSSRLFSEIREKRGLAYAVKGFLEQDKNYGHGMIYVGTTKESVKKVRELILKGMKGMQKLEKRDFEEAKEQLIGLKSVMDEDSSQVMISLISEENAGNVEEHYNYDERISAVKLKDVQELAKLKDYSFIALVPE